VPQRLFGRMFLFGGPAAAFLRPGGDQPGAGEAALVAKRF
jgi:hypothetical protein